MSRDEFRLRFAGAILIFFISIIVIIGSIQYGTPIPILIEVVVVAAVVWLALRDRRKASGSK